MTSPLDDAIFGHEPEIAPGLEPEFELAIDDDPTEPEITALGAVLFAQVPAQDPGAPPPEFRPELAALPTRSRVRATRWGMAALAFVATAGAAAGTYVALGRDGGGTPTREVRVRGADVTRSTAAPSTTASPSTTSSTTTTSTTSTTAAPTTTRPAGSATTRPRQPEPEAAPETEAPVPPPVLIPPVDPTTTTAPPTTTTTPPTTTEPPTTTAPPSAAP